MIAKSSLKNAFDTFAALPLLLFVLFSILLFLTYPSNHSTALLLISTSALSLDLLTSHTIAQHMFTLSINFLLSIFLGGKAHGKNLCIRY